jgi:hypothetical protein
LIGEQDVRLGREALIVLLDFDDVIEARHRPVGAETAVATPVYRRLPPQAPEECILDVAFVDLRLADIDVSDGDVADRDRSCRLVMVRPPQSWQRTSEPPMHTTPSRRDSIRSDTRGAIGASTWRRLSTNSSPGRSDASIHSSLTSHGSLEHWLPQSHDAGDLVAGRSLHHGADRASTTWTVPSC